MKIKYQFANGEVSEVEVEETVGNVLLESRRKEDNLSRKERYHCYSLDAVEYEGAEYADNHTPEKYAVQSEENQLLSDTLAILTEVQLRRVLMLANGTSIREIARVEGVSHTKVLKSITLARKKLKNFYK